MITVNWLLHLGHSATNAPISSLDCLEISYGSFVQVVKLRMMPVSFCTAEIFLVSPACPLSVTSNDWNIVLNVFQWQIQLQVIRLLWGSLVMCLISCRW